MQDDRRSECTRKIVDKLGPISYASKTRYPLKIVAVQPRPLFKTAGQSKGESSAGFRSLPGHLPESRCSGDRIRFFFKRLNVIVAGLTGGIASGKSTVTAYLKSNGAVIIDADQIARQVARKGEPGHRRIVEVFGESIVLPNGEIDRRRLGDIIFEDPRQKKRLEEIVHPLVLHETARRIAEIETREPDAVVILDVPLLFESGMDKDLTEIIVVYVPEQIQIRRLIDRDGYSRNEALARVRSQMPIEKKKGLATIVIDNTGSLRKTRKQAHRVYETLKHRAGRQ
jgi:dephospho-CoA kinase